MHVHPNPDSYLKTYFCPFYYKIPSNSFQWGADTVFRALACCDLPLPGKAIKVFFFSFPQNSVSAFQFDTSRQRLNFSNKHSKWCDRVSKTAFVWRRVCALHTNYNSIMPLTCSSTAVSCSWKQTTKLRSLPHKPACLEHSFMRGEKIFQLRILCTQNIKLISLEYM